MSTEDQKYEFQNKLYGIKDGSLIHIKSALSDSASRLNEIIESNDAARFGGSNLADTVEEARACVDRARDSLSEAINCIAQIEMLGEENE